MHIFEYKDNHYLSIKDHSFQILNALSAGYNNNVYIQCTTNSSSGILKEYLPQGWALQKKRYNGQMIFTLYKKNMFSYKSKSKSLGTTCFVAFSKEGAAHLLYRWILNERLNIDDTEKNIEVAKIYIHTWAKKMHQVVNNQKMFGVYFNISYHMNSIEYIESRINKKD